MTQETNMTDGAMRNRDLKQILSGRRREMGDEERLEPGQFLMARFMNSSVVQDDGGVPPA